MIASPPAWVADLETTAKVRRPKRSKREYVPHPCQCLDYASTGKPGPKRRRVSCAAEMCANGPSIEKGHGCQIYQLFRLAIESGEHPADLVEFYHEFEPTEDDRDHLDWVCWINCRAWLLPHELRTYAGIPEPVYMHKPAGFLRMSRLEQEVWQAAKDAELAKIQSDLDGIVIAEASLTEFLAVYRQRAEALPVVEPSPVKPYPFEPYAYHSQGMDPAGYGDQHHTR